MTFYIKYDTQFEPIPNDDDTGYITKKNTHMKRKFALVWYMVSFRASTSNLYLLSTPAHKHPLNNPRGGFAAKNRGLLSFADYQFVTEMLLYVPVLVLGRNQKRNKSQMWPEFFIWRRLSQPPTLPKVNQIHIVSLQ